MDEFKGDDVIPFSRQKVLKLDRTFRTDTPALAAAGALGHIVFECTLSARIGNAQGRCRTILHTGQTPGTVLIYAKIRHF